MLTSHFTLPEIFSRTIEKPTMDEKVVFLRKHKNKAMIWFLSHYAAQTRMKVPEFTPSTKPYGLNFSSISNFLPRLQQAIAFDKQGEEAKRDKMLLLVLESVHAEESALLSDLFSGKAVKGLDHRVIKKAFPDFFTERALPND